MVILSQFDYDGETYATAYNWLMPGRRAEFRDTITEDLNDELHPCHCDTDKRHVTQFKNDKLALKYCKTCGGVWKRSLPGNHY